MKTVLLTGVLLLNTLITFAYKCTLKGVVIDRESKSLFLQKVSDHQSREPQRLTIPITNHSFDFAFEVNDTEAYELIFADEWEAAVYNPIVFFPTSSVVNFKLYPQAQFAKDIVSGGELNKEYADYKNKLQNTFGVRQKHISTAIDSLNNLNAYRSLARDSIMTAIRGKNHADLDPGVWKRLTLMEETGEAYTPQGNKLRKEEAQIDVDKEKWEYAYINQHNTIFSYYLMLKDILYITKENTALLGDIKGAYPNFALKYPAHPYTKIFNNILTGLNKINPGEQFIDVTLPGLDGKKYRLADLAKGKYTLIDFWGSWCGPCIAASRTMIPVYNDFNKNKNSLKLTLKREKYDWLNLVEIDDKNHIWNRYGITNSTGMMLLIGPDGKIIAVDPTADMVRKTLAANL
jgi:thiol-disulfide isomerase/thioredoxin